MRRLMRGVAALLGEDLLGAICLGRANMPEISTGHQTICNNRNVMPLTKSPSKKAFQHNVAAEVKSGKPVKQAVAISYSVKREAQKKKSK